MLLWSRAVPGTEIGYAYVCYAMSGTDVPYAAICLRKCYAKSGTEIVYTATPLLRDARTELAYAATTFYAMCGYAATSSNTQHCIWSTTDATCQRYKDPICRRACYAMSGTEIAYLSTRVLCGIRYCARGATTTGLLARVPSPTLLRACCAMSGTDLRLCCYAFPTRCPVGASRLVGPGAISLFSYAYAVPCAGMVLPGHGYGEHFPAIALRACYGMSGTERAYGATRSSLSSSPLSRTSSGTVSYIYGPMPA
eukprot:3385885-Rhodomonas_salina.6